MNEFDKMMKDGRLSEREIEVITDDIKETAKDKKRLRNTSKAFCVAILVFIVYLLAC